MSSEIKCAECGASVMGRRTKYCSKKCQMTAFRLLGSKIANQNKRSRAAVKLASLIHPCETCSQPTVNKRFCSKSCSARTTNSTNPRRQKLDRGPTFAGVCIVCGTPVKSVFTKYCGSSCCAKHKRDVWVTPWLNGELNPLPRMPVLRRMLLELRGHACEECGWAGINPVTQLPTVEMDHRDGDRANNYIWNLRLLCPNCHSLTPTYRYLNSRKRRERAIA